MHCSAPLAHPAAVLHRFVAPMWQWRNSMMDGCGVKITKQPNGTFLAEEGQFVNDEWVSRGPRRCAEGGWWRARCEHCTVHQQGSRCCVVHTSAVVQKHRCLVQMCFQSAHCRLPCFSAAL